VTTAPNLDTRAEFAQQFRVRLEGDRGSGTTRAFTYTLRPLNEDVKEVPAVQMSYYNPQTDHFEAAWSNPLALQVTPASSVDAAIAPAPAGAGTPPTNPFAVLREIGQRGEVALARCVLSLATIALAVVLAACVVRRGMLRYRQHFAIHVAARQRRRQATSVRRTLRPSASPDDVRLALGDFLRARFNLPAGEATPHETFMHLTRAGVPDVLAHECAELLDLCALTLYGPGLAPIESGALASAARALLAALEWQCSPLHRFFTKTLHLLRAALPVRSPRPKPVAAVPSR
jgi:hypothetical protein